MHGSTMVMPWIHAMVNHGRAIVIHGRDTANHVRAMVVALVNDGHPLSCHGHK